MNITEEQCVKVLEDYQITSFETVLQNENKLVARVMFNNGQYEEELFFKVYNTKRYTNIEQVYTILNLLATKLEGEAKKNKDIFVNLLPKIYLTTRKDELFFVAEESIKGISLADSLSRGQYSSFPEFIKVIKQICDAVEMLHRPFPTIVHCDIKEENIVIDDADKVIKLIDFDAACIEGSNEKNSNLVRSTKGYVSPEMVNESPVAQSDIYSIGAIMENFVEKYSLKKYLDSQSVHKLDSIIEKSKGELKQRYDDVHELKQSLSELEILFMLRQKMVELDDIESYSVFSYENDNGGRIDRIKEMLINYPDMDILYVAVCEHHTMAFAMSGFYYIRHTNNAQQNQESSIDFLTYNQLVACVNNNIDQQIPPGGMLCISKTTSGQWIKKSMLVPLDAIDLICEILNVIVLYNNSHYTIERIAEYYATKCREANENLVKRELERKNHELSFWWDLIINLGELTYQREMLCGRNTCSCSEILLKVYGNKERSFRHSIKETPNGYFNDVLYSNVMYCLGKEKAYGGVNIEDRQAEFERRIVTKRQELQSLQVINDKKRK